MPSDPNIVVALDFSTESEALSLCDRLDPGKCRVKIGKELFTRCGPASVEKLVAKGFDVFLDLKFHDIPNTVAAAVRAAAEMGAWMINVHASGGRRMMEAAREALESFGENRPLLIAVTVLTSMGNDDLKEVGVTVSAPLQVSRLATLAKDSGLDGVVCSAQEASDLKAKLGKDFLLVTPGIRPEGTDAGDQRRIMTPKQAILAGSDYLVIGRPITQHPDPLLVLSQLAAEVDAL